MSSRREKKIQDGKTQQNIVMHENGPRQKEAQQTKHPGMCLLENG
jgi:hypothetical protein